MFEAAIFLPLLSFLIVGSVGNLLGNRFSHVLSCGFLITSAVLSVFIFNDIVMGKKVLTIPLLNWITVGDFSVQWSLHFDALSAVMVGVVTIVSSLVHVYSIGYMERDPSIPRFMSYLSLFTFMMLMLVTAGNLGQLFFGWEGVGLSSYLLIGFWFQKESACAAAIKAFVVNRIGDFGLVIGLALIFYIFQTIDIGKILTQSSNMASETISLFGYNVSVFELIALLLFLGAMGKSAQLGLHVWLPDAMEGPTPVSALIHAATMVTAGVFLIARMSPLFELAPFARDVIAFVGASTALFAGTIAVTQTDIKRVIAYSTCSQLGYMFFALGVSAYSAAIFHLMTHAFFKALLFLGAGAVIHGMSNEQDMKNMGGLAKLMPFTCVMMWIGSLALAGIPFFAGYYSKDAILEAAWNAHTPMGQYAYLMGIFAAVLTAFYSWRLLFMTFHGTPRADEKVLAHVHEPGMSMFLPLFCLGVGALFAGYAGFKPFMETGEDFWGKSLILKAELEESLPVEIEFLPLIAGIFGIFVQKGRRPLHIGRRETNINPDAHQQPMGICFGTMDKFKQYTGHFSIIDQHIIRPFQSHINFGL